MFYAFLESFFCGDESFMIYIPFVASSFLSTSLVFCFGLWFPAFFPELLQTPDSSCEPVDFLLWFFFVVLFLVCVGGKSKKWQWKQRQRLGFGRWKKGSLLPGWQNATCLLAALHSGLLRLCRSYQCFFYNGLFSVSLFHVSVKGQLMKDSLVLWFWGTDMRKCHLLQMHFTTEHLFTFVLEEKYIKQWPRHHLVSFTSVKSV